MASKAPSLAELQERFQAALMAGDDAVLGLIPNNSRTSNAVLLGVYRHAYVARLVEVVRAAHPLLARYMGEDAFETMARQYVGLHPSRHRNARWYADDVTRFLGGMPFDATPALAEIASIERQLDLAFDAEDAPVLDLAGLAETPPEAWGTLVFTPHPSAALIPLHTNAFNLWLALKDEDELPEAERLAEPEHFLVWREGAVPRIRRLGGEERMLWAEASNGASFGALMELAALYDDPGTSALRVAQYLQGWLASGVISRAMTTASEPARV